MRRGKFELADGGSILDEVGDLHAGSQAKLLRVLQEGEFHRVGGEQTVRVTVRVVAATNRDLNDMIAQGKFREDLYYRLCVVPIRVPSLRGAAGCSGAGTLFPGRILHAQQLSVTYDRRPGVSDSAAVSMAGQRARTAERG